MRATHTTIIILILSIKINTEEGLVSSSTVGKGGLLLLLSLWSGVNRFCRRLGSSQPDTFLVCPPSSTESRNVSRNPCSLETFLFETIKFLRFSVCSTEFIITDVLGALTTPLRLPVGGEGVRKSINLIEPSSKEMSDFSGVANSFCAAATLSMAEISVFKFASFPESSSASLSCVIKPVLRCSLGNSSVTTDSFALTLSSLSRDEALGTWLLTTNKNSEDSQ